MLRVPPKLTPFPYTTLFRSRAQNVEPRLLTTEGKRNPHLRTPRAVAKVKPRSLPPAGSRHSRDTASPRVAQVFPRPPNRSEEHTSELQSLRHLVCRLLLEKK